MWKKALRIFAVLFVTATFAYADIGVLATNNSYTGTSIKCDGSTNDASAMGTLISDLQAIPTPTAGTDYSNKTCITFPANATCKFNSGLTINAELLGLCGDGTTFDFSGMSTAGATATPSIGTGNGSTTQFRATGLPLEVPGTLTVTAGAVTGTDGSSLSVYHTGTAITGTGITSGVNSSTLPYDGQIQVLFATPVGSGTPVTASYTTYLPALTLTTSNNDYGQAATIFRGIHMIGPGSTSKTVGLLINGNELQIDQFTAHEFAIGTEANGSLPYLIRYYNPHIWNTTVAMDLVGGENYNVFGGTLFNSVSDLYNAAEANFFGTSFDFTSGPFILNAYGALKISNAHIEGNAIGTNPIIEAIGCNAFSYTDIKDSQILVDSGSSVNEPLIELDGHNTGLYFETGCAGNGFGEWVKVKDNFINNLFASGLTCEAGSGVSDCITGTTFGSGNSNSPSQYYPMVSLQDNTAGGGGGWPNNLNNTGF